MSDEKIKTFLQDIIDCNFNQPLIDNITSDVAQNILDYITNLQQENEYLKKKNDEKTKIGIADHKYASQMEDKAILLQQEKEDYKSRVEKAIEYINKNLTLVSILDGKKIYGLNDYKFSYQDLLNILQGGKDE